MLQIVFITFPASFVPCCNSICLQEFVQDEWKHSLETGTEHQHVADIEVIHPPGGEPQVRLGIFYHILAIIFCDILLFVWWSDRLQDWFNSLYSQPKTTPLPSRCACASGLIQIQLRLRVDAGIPNLVPLKRKNIPYTSIIFSEDVCQSNLPLRLALPSCLMIDTPDLAS